MQTQIDQKFRDHPDIDEAEAILRSCVHCGFCTATCPTYQLLGDELDGPRGRIYLIKQVLEGKGVTEKTQLHLDRCLTCRSCETTCPSGVRYGRLVDIGREIVEQKVERSWLMGTKRWALRKVLPYPARFNLLLQAGRLARPLLPASLAKKIPARQRLHRVSESAPGTRTMLVLGGCAQSVATPRTNQSAMRVLQKLGIRLVDANGAGCCGAVSQHLSAPEEALQFMRRNIDAWWPHIEDGAEAVVITASGCGSVVKEYGELLRHDAAYADRARRVSELAMDLSEVVMQEAEKLPPLSGDLPRVACHSPCTLQHGQKLPGMLENLLQKLGFELTEVEDPHLCCGSAGTYSILQPEISTALLTDKLNKLQKQAPDVIATANVGCQLHLNSAAERPVLHWIELLDQHLAESDNS